MIYPIGVMLTKAELRRASPGAEGDAHAGRNRAAQRGHCCICVCLAGFLRQPYCYGVHGPPAGSPNEADYYPSASVTEACRCASDPWAGSRSGSAQRGSDATSARPFWHSGTVRDPSVLSTPRRLVALLYLGLLLTRVEDVWASAKGIMIVFSGSYLRQRTGVVWHLAYRWCHACLKHCMMSVCMAL